MQRMFGFDNPRIAPAMLVALLVLSACSGTAADPAAVAGMQPSTSTPITAGVPAAANAGVSAPGSAPTLGSAPAVSAPAPSAGASAPSAQPVPAATPQPGAATMSNVGGMAAPATGQPVSQLPTASVTITVPSVAPGAEDTRCVHMRLPGSVALNVIKLHNRLSNGSHHYILTAVSDSAASEKPLERCTGFGGSVSGAPLSITQAHDDYVQLPAGVGYHLNAGQILRLELHYINTSDQTLDISATSELFAAEPGAQIQEGAVMLIGTADFTIPAHAAKETAPKFLALPAGMEDVKFYAITGHTHRFGTNVKVSLASPQMQPTMQLYAPEHFDWESPDTTQISPHVSVAKGGGFLLQCAWNNTAGNSITWGESATDEMCFFWGYYYPRKDVFSIVVDNIDQNALKRIAGAPPPP